MAIIGLFFRKVLGLFVQKPLAHNVMFVTQCKVVKCVHQNSPAFGFPDDEEIPERVFGKHNFSVDNLVDVVFRIFIYNKFYPLAQKFVAGGFV